MTIATLSTNGNNQYALASPVTTLFIGTIDGLSRLERGAGGWTVARSGLQGSHVSSLTHDGEALFAAQMPGKLMASDDSGVTWEQRFAGVTEYGAYSLRSYGDVLYLGTQPVGLYRSTDGGRNWTDLASLRTAPLHDTWRFPAPGHEPHLKSLAVDPRDSERIYAAVEQGALLRSDDGGASWKDLDGFADYEHFVYKDLHQVMLRPSNPDEVYITTGLGIFHSPDRGESFEQLTDSAFRIGYPDQLLFAPDDDARMFVSGGFATPNFWVEERSAKGTLMLSEDGGRNWRAPSGGFPENKSNVEALTISAFPGGYEIFAGNSDGEVFCSADEGETWTRIASGLPAICKPTHDDLIAGKEYVSG